jgi:DNA invertase Pin-like site-specific DNA recombinase
MQDKSRKGRSSGGILYGELNPAAKLCEQQVRQIRKDREDGQTLKVIARQYNVSIATIHRVVNRVFWGTV